MPDRDDPIDDQKADEIASASALPMTPEPQHLLAARLQSIPRDLQFVADGPSGYAHHVFISHRGTQKKEVAFPIMAIFSYFCGPHFAVFDETTFQLGESNHTVISRALSKCAHCLVLVSQDFFQSKWTVAEADAFLKESEKVNAQEQRKVISLFIGFSPGQCRSLKSNFCHEDNEFLSEETIRHRQRIAKKLGTLNGREQAKDRVLGDESIREFILKQMPDLLENELRFENGTRPALLPEFHNRVDPVLLAHVYDGAVRYYEKVKGKVNASSLDTLIRELKENAPQACQGHERFVFEHRVSGEGTAHRAHAEYLSDDLPSHTSAETLLQLQRQKMQLFFSSGKTLSVEHHLDNKRPISNVSTSVLTTRARDEAILVSPDLEKNEASEAAAAPVDLADLKESDAASRHGVPHDSLPFLEDSSRRPSAVPCIAWYFSEGASLKTFQLRVENKTWQMDFENLRLPVFSPLLQQGSILASHQAAHEILCEYLLPVKRDEAGRIVLISGLAGLGKSRLVQHYLYQQDKTPSEERHAMIAWLSGQTEETFDAQWKALADQFRTINSTLNGMDDSTAIKKWFEEQQSQWLLIIDDWQFLDVEKILKKLPSKAGHVVITTRHPVTYFDHSEMRAQSRILLDVKLNPLSMEESKQLIEAHFGMHWKVLGHKEETEALNTLVSTIGGFPQGLVQTATHVRKKGIGFSRYITQLTHSPALQWQLLSDTVLGTFTPTETLAYQWGTSKKLFLQRLCHVFPNVALSLHDEVLIVWLARLASCMPSSFHQQEEEKSSADATKVFSPEFLKQQWQEMITAQFPELREMVDIDQLWAVYQAGLSDYFPLHFVVPEGKSILVSPVVHHLLLKGFPTPPVDPSEANLAVSVFKEASKQAGKREEEQEKDEEKEEEKKSDVPFSHSTFFGENARVGHLRSNLFVLGSPDELQAWKLPTENVDFIPRPYATKDLSQKLATVNSADQDTRQVVLTTAVSGMGGVGKTELARHYVHHSKNNEDAALNRDYQRRFWFDASSLSQIRISFRELGLALQLIESKDDDTEVLKHVHKWLQLHPGWLVVFDNADDYQAVADWIPAKGGTVLVTTREHTPGQLPDQQIVRVTVLEEQEAVQWLCQLSRRNPSTLSAEERIAATELVKSLGYLPLAIVQVAAYLRIHQEMRIEDYLKKFISDCVGSLSEDTLSERKKETNTQELDSDAFSRKIVAKTWNISLEVIQATADKKCRPNMAEYLLTMCAYLAPIAIPISVLEVLLKQKLSDQVIDKSHSGYFESCRLTAYLFDEHLSELLRYSLIQRDPYLDTVSVHRLVQQVIRHQISMDEREKQITYVIQCLTALNPNTVGNGNAAQEQREKAFMPHLETIITHHDQSAIENEHLALALGQLGNLYYYLLGQPKKCIGLYQRTLKIEEIHHGQDNYKVAITLMNLGNAYGTLGDTTRERDLLERALAIQEAHYGHEHYQVALTLMNLGTTYGALGDMSRQRDLLERALKIQGTHFGWKHYQVALTLMNLSTAYGALGDTSRKRDLLEYALAIQEAHYGREHYKVAITLGNLGNAYGELGDTSRKRDLLERALVIFEAHYGQEHYQVGATLMNLGNAYGDLGDTNRKRDLQEHALAILEKHYVREHYKVAITLVCLGNTYGELGDTTRKRDLLEYALAIQETHYGRDNYQVAITLTNLGDAYRDLGDTARARDSLERALAIKEAHYGREHSELVITLLKLTVIYHMLKQQNNSFNTFQRACRIRANHPITKQDRKALSDNLFSYWNKYKKPLGVAAVVVGIGTVYIARSRKLFR